ncbi:MAG: DUF86 domain-containing protein, partial [Candidatus Sigynarchaeota archaeon]
VDFFLDEILNSIDMIENKTQKMSIEEFKSDEFLIDGIVRNLEIIGEAAKNVSKDIQNQFKEIPWKKIIGLRNIISHRYFKIDPEIVWVIITKDLPDLKPRVRKLKEILQNGSIS